MLLHPASTVPAGSGTDARGGSQIEQDALAGAWIQARGGAPRPCPPSLYLSLRNYIADVLAASARLLRQWGGDAAGRGGVDSVGGVAGRWGMGGYGFGGVVVGEWSRGPWPGGVDLGMRKRRC